MHYCDTEIPEQIRTSIQLLDKAFLEWRTFLEMLSGKKDLDGQKFRLKKQHCENSLWDERIIPSCTALAEQMKKMGTSLALFCKELETLKEVSGYSKLMNHMLELQSLCSRTEEASVFLKTFIRKEVDVKCIRWIEVFRSNIALFEASLDVSSFCQEHLFSPLSSAVLCSATLATSQEFTYTKERLGLHNHTVSERVYNSPFDFASRCMLLVPTDLPLPNEPSYLSQVIFTIERAIEKSQGSAFVLFTSYDMLSHCYRELSSGAIARKYPFCKQGDLPRAMRYWNSLKSGKAAYYLLRIPFGKASMFLAMH